MVNIKSEHIEKVKTHNQFKETNKKGINIHYLRDSQSHNSPQEY
jgi:hypothetical protein